MPQERLAWQSYLGVSTRAKVLERDAKSVRKLRLNGPRVREYRVSRP
jgi:hypothetical protein